MYKMHNGVRKIPARLFQPLYKTKSLFSKNYFSQTFTYLIVLRSSYVVSFLSQCFRKSVAIGSSILIRSKISAAFVKAMVHNAHRLRANIPRRIAIVIDKYNYLDTLIRIINSVDLSRQIIKKS